MTVENEKEALSTQDKLLEAAGALFLERGYDHVSVRDITEAAGTNVAAVNYHFGGKPNLYREFLRKILSESTAEKVRELTAMVEEHDTIDLQEIIRYYVVSFIGCMLSDKEGTRMLELLSNEMSENSIAVDVLYKEAVAPVHKVIKTAVLKAVPGITPEKASLCMASIAGQVFHFVRAKDFIKRLTGRGYSKEFIEDIVTHITEFSLRGIGWYAKEAR